MIRIAKQEDFKIISERMTDMEAVKTAIADLSLIQQDIGKKRFAVEVQMTGTDSAGTPSIINR